MIDALALVASIALPWLAGVLCVLAIRRGAPERGPLLAIGYGYLFGLIVATLALRAATASGLRWSLAFVVAVLLVVITIAYALARPLPSPGSAWRAAIARVRALPAPMNVVFWGCVALIAVRFAGLALEVVWRPLLPWDAWSQWGTKSRVWFEYARLLPFVLPHQWLAGGEPLAFVDMHSNYPGTVPLVQVYTNLWLGRFDEALMDVPWPVVGLTLGAAFYAQARRAGVGMPKAMVFTYALLSLPFLDIHMALAGVADIFVASAYGLAAMSLWQWTRTRERGDFVLAVLFAAVCPAIKLEGTFWALTLLPGVLVALNRRVGFIVIALLVAGAFGYLAFGPERVVVFGYVLRTHFTDVSLPLAQHLFVMDNWHLLWYATLVIIALSWRKLFASDWAPMTVTIGGALAFVAAVFYYSSAAGGVADESLVNRLPLHLTPALAFYLLLLLQPPAREAASSAAALPSAVGA
jgi:hypothetical protein